MVEFEDSTHPTIWSPCFSEMKILRLRVGLTLYLLLITLPSADEEWWASKTRPTLQLRFDNEIPVTLPSADEADLVPGAWHQDQTSSI